jgi:dTDP-4-dehydrorhamnose reductase
MSIGTYPRAPKPIVIVGASGQLGTALVSKLNNLGPVVGLDRRALDLTDTDAVRRQIRATQPRVLINAAAYTAVDKAEDEPDIAMAVNGIAPGVLAEEAARAGACFVHYSTDYVFAGDATRPYCETDTAAPINAYGHSKLAGEKAVIAANPAALILRTCWVYGAHGANFLRTMQRLANTRTELAVVDDQIGNPTSTGYLAHCTAEILSQIRMDPAALADKAGIYHVSSTGAASWCAFARAILSASHPHVRVNPIATADYPTKARRPAYCVLDKTKLLNTFAISPPPWQEMLRAVLSEQEQEQAGKPGQSE